MAVVTFLAQDLPRICAHAAVLQDVRRRSFKAGNPFVTSIVVPYWGGGLRVTQVG